MVGRAVVLMISLLFGCSNSWWGVMASNMELLKCLSAEG